MKVEQSSIDQNWRKSISEEFKKLELDLIVYLTIFLSFKISRGFYQRRIAFTGSSDFIFYDKVTNEAFNIFINWPQSFYDFLNYFKKIPKNNQLLTGLKRDFGRFHFEINKLSLIPGFRFFTEEYKNYIRYIWDGGSGPKILDANLNSKYISAYQASKLLGTKSINFSTLINEGTLEGRIVLRPSKNLILIDISSLENYKKQRDLSPKSNRNQVE
ncbi:hypothetical protein OB236_22320 [Paenibacillus sp. WQ 127069]|uniref:Helix-turn-helix domain-containing protein n=1 Tax=Paenibacillus baimaensis TaxID=2982185 RepID=A0ABT2UJN3_9BACL|nr:hypothetical protein [Paenibacillus sp. WQ 127069]MCU6794852.1 hypothetical protein [Paenibacillus sp. WQ 127069]